MKWVLSQLTKSPVLFLELVCLMAVLVLVDVVLVRLVLGFILVVMMMGTARELEEKKNGLPTGQHDRRTNHLFRHILNSLIKKAREFHLITEHIKAGNTGGAASLKREKVKKELQHLLDQATHTADSEPANSQVAVT